MKKDLVLAVGFRILKSNVLTTLDQTTLEKGNLALNYIKIGSAIYTCQYKRDKVVVQ